MRILLTARTRKIGKKAQAPSASIWFARIVYFFLDHNDVPSAHMRWMTHGGDTILADTASPKELFLLSRCHDVPLGAIASKITIDYRGRGAGCSGVGVIEESYHAVIHYFYRLAYSEVDESFEEACLYQDCDTSQTKTEKAYCDCCEIAKEKEKSVSTSLIGQAHSDGRVESISHRGIPYRFHDFVYLLPKDPNEPYVIAQIITSMKLKGLSQWLKSNLENISIRMSVQVYERHDTLLEPYLDEVNIGGGNFHVRDNRRLYRTNDFLSLSQDRLDGKCVIKHSALVHDLNDSKDMDDTFHVADKVVGHSTSGLIRLQDLQALSSAEFQPCKESDRELVTEISRVSAFLTTGQRLRAMDVFAGAGGLTAGLEESGIITTEWAIESDVAAASTFKFNFPHVHVYNHDASVVLRQAIEENMGTSNGPLKDFSGRSLPRLPKPGEVDIIYGGNPCQDFTRCNLYLKANSIKNSLLATYLSYVDHSRPKYFLLENVKDLLNHRLGSSQINIHKTTGGIEMGAAKFILRALISMGYQARFGILQAGEHGTPQSRQRIFFWASLPGYRLPKFPEPSHVFSGKRSKCPRSTRRSAPHRGITVGDTLVDLPAFDWQLEVPGESQKDRVKRKQRARSVKQFKPPFADRVGDDAQKYSSRHPLSEYTRHLHETMERVLRIPTRPYANHMDIPAVWDLRCLRHRDSKAAKNNFYPDRYRRLDFKKVFRTCLTRVDPFGKNGTILHPTQHRILTVREQARTMGFPDSFIWDHKTQKVKEMYKQNGNAVAIPVARALGQELLRVVINRWESERVAGDPDYARQSIEFYDDTVEMQYMTNSDLDSELENLIVDNPKGMKEFKDENGDVWMEID